MECSSSGDNSTSPVSSHQHPPSEQSLLPISGFSAAAVSEIISLPRFIITLAEKAAVSILPKHPPTIVIQPASCLSSSPHRLCGVDCPEDKKERRRPFHKSHKKEWTNTQCQKWMWWSWKKFSGTFESKHVPRKSLWLYIPKLKLTTGTGWWVVGGFRLNRKWLAEWRLCMKIHRNKWMFLWFLRCRLLSALLVLVFSLGNTERSYCQYNGEVYNNKQS